MTGKQEMRLASIPDDALIPRILEGEKRLFELLIRRHNQRLYRIGMSVLGDEAETQDAMQTAYIRAYEHLAAFEGRSSFCTWLTRIMLNQCYGQKRRKNNRLPVQAPPDNFVNMNTPVNAMINKELSGLLERAVTGLPEKYRLVFVLREIEGVSVRETAELLRIGETNVKVRLNRAKIMLRKNLNGYIKDHVFGFHLAKCDAVADYVMNRLGVV